MKECRLKLDRCHRGGAVRLIKTGIKLSPHLFTQIKTGPLKGCWRQNGVWRIYRFGRGHVLEFHGVLRVDA